VRLAQLLSAEGVSRATLADRSGVILDADALQVLAVNETGVCLIEAIHEGIDDHEGLVRTLVDTFDVDPNTAARDVDAFVAELAGHLGRDGT
jgi:hypothetical protein